MAMEKSPTPVAINWNHDYRLSNIPGFPLLASSLLSSPPYKDFSYDPVYVYACSGVDSFYFTHDLIPINFFLSFLSVTAKVHVSCDNARPSRVIWTRHCFSYGLK